MTPIGHGALGYLVGKGAPKLPTWAVIAGAVVPDVDYAVVWAPQFNAWHRVVTHNVTFVIAVAAVAGLCAPRRFGERGTVAAALAVGGVTHLATDSVLDTNPTNGIGVAWTWPWIDVVWSPFNLATVGDNPAGWGDPVEASKGVVASLLWEVPIWVVAMAVYLWFRRRSTDRGARAPSVRQRPRVR